MRVLLPKALALLCVAAHVDAFRALNAAPLTSHSLRLPICMGHGDAAPQKPSRRALLPLALGAALALRPRRAAAEFPEVGSIKQADIDTWDEFEGVAGLRSKDVKEGLGVSTKDGDRLRVRFTVYLLDGTVVSRGAGVEQEFTLGRGMVPPGFENGVRDMKAGGERVLYIPAEAGWSSEYRDAALAQIKSCRGACALDEQPVIVFAKLEGYKKAECKGGDMPVSVKTGSLTTGSGFSDFKIEVRRQSRAPG